MADIFGYKRSPKPKGVFSTEDSMLTFGSVKNPIGYLVQQWQITYQQQVTELFEIGSNALYWAKGRPRGDGVIGRVIGDVDADSPNKGFFPPEAYDLCKGGVLLKLTAKSGACQNPNSFASGVKQLSVDMDGCVVTTVGFSMRVADVMLNEQMGWRFAFMQLN